MIEVTQEELTEEYGKVLDAMCEWGLKAVVAGMDGMSIRKFVAGSALAMPTARSKSEAQNALREIAELEGGISQWIDETGGIL